MHAGRFARCTPCALWWLLEKPVSVKLQKQAVRQGIRMDLDLNALGALLLSGVAWNSVGLLGEKNRLDVGQHTSLRNGHTSQQLVQLLVVPDGQLKVAGVNPLLLVVTCSVSSQLEDFGGEVLHNGCQVDRGTRSDTLGVVALSEETVNTANWELKTCSCRPALGLCSGLASLSTSGHFVANKLCVENYIIDSSEVQ